MATNRHYPAWAKKPFIYEINTRVWLTDLSRIYNRYITLHNVPDEVLDQLATYQFDAIWLMGVWARGDATWRSALNYIHEYRGALPDIMQDDVAGSAYAIQNYIPDTYVGGRDGLAKFRSRLAKRGIKLILDYVPNHVATDHPWTRTNPDYFVNRTAKALKRYPGMFFPAFDQQGRKYAIAHGRDPYFPSWIDTAQLNAFDSGLRQATINTLLDIGAQCDGVRCDMAMLMLNHVFNHTWGAWIDDPTPEVEFWDEVIPQVRAAHPNMLFMAEVYWGLEYSLLQQGFDFTYDKTLYDRIFTDDLGKMRVHLGADIFFQEQNVRFIENHDEQRAAAAFGIPKSKMGATLICTLPGATLLHDGQFQGRKIKLPVHLARQPEEPIAAELETFYQALLAETRHPIYQDGCWQLLDTAHGLMLAYRWYNCTGNAPDEQRIIVANLTGGSILDSVRIVDWTPELKLSDSLDATRAYPVESEGWLTFNLAAYETRIVHVEPISTPVLEAKPERTFDHDETRQSEPRAEIRVIQ